jgi:hypothetical protein
VRVSAQRAGKVGDGNLRVVAGSLAPGRVIGDGRYRLLARTGVDGRERAQFWRARDGRFNRDVALTVFTGDPANARVRARVRRTLDRAARMTCVAHTGLARVLNVESVGDGLTSSEGVAGMVVGEWVPGPDLIELVAGRPLAPDRACRLVEPLAVAVEEAHHRGAVFGVGHPRRFRLTPDRGLRLAFPGPPPTASPADDVRGLGGILYLLLTSRWPATKRPHDLPTPRQLHPAVPAELSDLVMRCLAGEIRTSATLLPVLRQVIEDADRTAVLTPAPVEDPVTSNGIWITKRPANDPVRKKKLAIAATVLVVAAMAVVAWIGVAVGDLFGADAANGGGPPVSVAPPAPAVAANPVAPASVTVFNADAVADVATAREADKAIDGDPATTWQTGTYPRQFPSVKPGVGLIVTFQQPVTLSKVGIDSPAQGTQVQIRTAPSADAPLAETQVVGSATLSAGANTIDVRVSGQTQYVLIWITRLAGTDQHYESAIGELSFTA